MESRFWGKNRVGLNYIVDGILNPPLFKLATQDAVVPEKAAL